jgi:hypothetical protein
MQRMAILAVGATLSGQSTLGQGQCVCSARPAPGIHLDARTLAAMGTVALISKGDYPCALSAPTIFTACQSWKQAGGVQTVAPEGLAGARKRFWETYPDKPGAEKARQEFAEWLFLKDVLYLKAALITGKRKDARDDPRDFIRTLNGAGLLGFGGSPVIDGGISLDAANEYYDWAMEVRDRYAQPGNPFGQGLSIGLMGPDVEKAIEESSAKYQKYVAVRDWREFDAQGRTPVGFEGAPHYGALLYLRDGDLKPAEAQFAYCSVTKVLGASVAELAAQKVLLAPKDRDGNLVQRAGLPRGEAVNDLTPMPDGVIGVYRGKLRAFEKLMTQDDDRRYLLSLLAPLNRDQRGVLDMATQWCFADSVYNRYVAAFGLTAVLQAAHAVRVTPKRMKDGWVLDTKAIGSTRFEPYPAFQDVLSRSEPRGYVKAMLTFGQNLYSATEIDGAYLRLSAAHGENAVLDAARKMAAARPDLTAGSDLQTLLGMLGENVQTSQGAARPLLKARSAPANNRMFMLQLQYGADQNTAKGTRARLDITERTLKERGKSLPPDVIAARDQIDSELIKVGDALNRGEADQAEQGLQSVSAALRTLQVFMNQVFIKM